MQGSASLYQQCTHPECADETLPAFTEVGNRNCLRFSSLTAIELLFHAIHSLSEMRLRLLSMGQKRFVELD